MFNAATIVSASQIGDADGFHFFSPDYTTNSDDDRALFSIDLARTPFLLALPEAMYQQVLNRL